MASELKRGSLEGCFRGVEEKDKLNGLEDCFMCELLLAFFSVIVGVGRPVIFCPGVGLGSPTVLGGPAKEFGLFSLPGTELGSCGMREDV